MISNEQSLVTFLTSRCKHVERIENAAKGGTPDTVVPTYSGWRWFELKTLHGSELIFQNTQLAFFVKNRRLPQLLWAHVLVAIVGTEQGFILDPSQLLKLPKRPYVRGKSALKVPLDQRAEPLETLISPIGLHVDL